jgi:menaquinone-dependent protoporphyrinogen oxidase
MMPLVRCEVPVFYATTEGQTHRIAERLAERLNQQGVDSRAFDVDGDLARSIDWVHVRGVLVGASLHAGRYQSAAGRFVRSHAAQLNLVPSAFVAVSLSAASSNADEVAAAKALAAAFPRDHGWRAGSVVSVAGRLAYTRYNFFVKQMMKRIARKQGAPTDTRRDYEFTNWQKIDQFADRFAADLKTGRQAA